MTTALVHWTTEGFDLDGKQHCVRCGAVLADCTHNVVDSGYRGGMIAEPSLPGGYVTVQDGRAIANAKPGAPICCDDR